MIDDHNKISIDNKHILLLLGISLIQGTICSGEIVHRFEPISYSSIQDSPIANDTLLANFMFEDFEDGLLNLTGLSTISGLLFPSSVVNSDNDYVDSVERSPQGFGHSLASTTHLVALSYPPIHQFMINFDLDADELGYIPNAFGFAWTDGPESSGMTISVTKLDGTEVILESYLGLGDDTRKASSEDDVFLGFKGIEFQQIRLIGGYFGVSDGLDFFEIDHLQFGRINAVPEPHSIVILAILLNLFFVFHRRIDTTIYISR